jgi:hypothetical protein
MNRAGFIDGLRNLIFFFLTIPKPFKPCAATGADNLFRSIRGLAIKNPEWRVA